MVDTKGLCHTEQMARAISPRQKFLVDTLHEKYLLRESSQRLAFGLTLVSIPLKGI